MPNPIKYTTGSETLALKKGNFYIGTGAVGKGPTSETGYYNGVTPPSGGYTIYLNKASGGPSIYTCANDAQLISLTNIIAGQSYTTIQQCFDYYYGQTDKVVVTQDYPPTFPYIVMDGLVLYLDAGITLSYSGSGTVWADINGLGPKNNGTLTNGPTFSSDGGGSIVFDGVDDYVTFSKVPSLTNQLTMECWFYLNAIQSQNQNRLISNGDYYVIYLATTSQLSFYMSDQGGYIYSTGNAFLNSWNHIVATYNGTNRAIYINGVLKTTSNASGNVNNGSILNIGAFQNQPVYTINGKMPIMRIYNKGLSSTEVLQNYQAVFPRILGENIITNGLVLYLDAKYRTSYPTTGTTWFNVSGVSGATGTLTNGPTYSSANGGSIVFDGVDDYVYFGNPSSLQFGNTFSYGCWFYWTNVNTQAILMGKRNGGDSGYNQYGMSIAETVCCGPAGKKLGVCLISDKNSGGGNCSYNCGINATLPNSEGWVYGICTVGQYEQKLYINGTLAAESNDVLTNCTFNVPNRSFYVGCTGGETEGTVIFPFNNKIAVAQAYNKTLSASEVLQNYNAQKSRFGL